MRHEPILRAEDLVVRYRGQEAVRGVSFSLGRGEVLGLIGPDGAGKTSTLRVMTGLLRASSGRAEAFGQPCWASRRALHHRVGYLAQRFALYGDLTVNENVQFFALMHGVREWRKRRAELLALVDLERFGEREADRLSGGMRQRLALACTLIHSPEILVLDEPTTGVDPVTRRELWRLLAELVGQDLTLVVATPYLDEAERCTRVVLLHEGHVLADDTPELVRQRLPGALVDVVARPRAAAVAALRRRSEVLDVTVFGAGLHVRVEPSSAPAEVVELALHGQPVQLESVEVIRPSLEDAFLFLTRSTPDPVASEAP